MSSSPFWLVNLDDIFGHLCWFHDCNLYIVHKSPSAATDGPQFFSSVYNSTWRWGWGEWRFAASYPSQVALSPTELQCIQKKKTNSQGYTYSVLANHVPGILLWICAKCYLIGSHLGCSAHHWTFKSVDWMLSFQNVPSIMTWTL